MVSFKESLGDTDWRLETGDWLISNFQSLIFDYKPLLQRSDYD